MAAVTTIQLQGQTAVHLPMDPWDSRGGRQASEGDEYPKLGSKASSMLLLPGRPPEMDGIKTPAI